MISVKHQDKKKDEIQPKNPQEKMEISNLEKSWTVYPECFIADG